MQNPHALSLLETKINFTYPCFMPLPLYCKRSASFRNICGRKIQDESRDRMPCPFSQSGILFRARQIFRGMDNRLCQRQIWLPMPDDLEFDKIIIHTAVSGYPKPLGRPESGFDDNTFPPNSFRAGFEPANADCLQNTLWDTLAHSAATPYSRQLQV